MQKPFLPYAQLLRPLENRFGILTILDIRQHLHSVIIFGYASKYIQK
jgi:hypothetical protein